MANIRMEKTREGNRGGRGLFSWNDIKAREQSDRSHYIGHSVMAPTGKEANCMYWYASNSTSLDARCAPSHELQAVKAQEEALMSQALGVKPSSSTPAKTGASSAPELAEHEIKGMLSRQSRTADADDAEEQAHRGRGLGYKATVGGSSKHAPETKLVKCGELGGVDAPSAVKDEPEKPEALENSEKQRDESDDGDGDRRKRRKRSRSEKKRGRREREEGEKVRRRRRRSKSRSRS